MYTKVESLKNVLPLLYSIYSYDEQGLEISSFNKVAKKH